MVDHVQEKQLFLFLTKSHDKRGRRDSWPAPFELQFSSVSLQGPRCRRQRRRTVSRARLGWGSQTQPAPTFGRGTRIITRSQSNSRITSPAARPVPRGPQGASKAAPRTSCLTWRPSRKTALCLWLTAESRSCLSQEEVRPRCPGPRSWSVASPWLVHCPLTQS